VTMDRFSRGTNGALGEILGSSAPRGPMGLRGSVTYGAQFVAVRHNGAP